ncbi:MAG: delta 1-pyrroline-5-carboxylate synthetase [Crenarchaeota archaeon]|nr:delta 1-pyrroline-5-carboxylate synthetase [Thermoproteota archaeon]
MKETIQMTITVVKIGGSIATYPDELRALCKKISVLSKKFRVVVVPGGGEFADTVRQLDQRYNLTIRISHHMAIYAMNQYGLMLTDLIPDSVVVEEVAQTKIVLDKNLTPVFLPAKLMLAEDPLENSWNVTSDSIAFYIAAKLEASKLVVVTDVDGIYNNDPKIQSSLLINQITAKELVTISKRTSIDITLPKLLKNSNLSCVVLNGLYPDRLESALMNQKVVGTLISNFSNLKK